MFYHHSKSDAQFSQHCCPQLFHSTQIPISPGCLEWLCTAGKSLLPACPFSIFTLNTYLTCWSDCPLPQTHQEERKLTTANQGPGWFAPSKCFLREWLTLSTSIFSFFQGVTVCLLCSNKYLLLAAWNYWFHRESGGEKINYNMPGTHFGKTKPPKIKASVVGFILSSLPLALIYTHI